MKSFVLSISLVLILVFTAVDVQARGCHNPLFLPFAVAGAVVGTVAAITTAVVSAPVYPAYSGYYAPDPGDYRPYYSRPEWIPGHYDGYRVPGHWR
jgi:hypothetical protein